MDITSQNFEKEVLQSNMPVIVDFWASWCNPCKMMIPIMNEIEEELKEEVKVCKVNVDEERDLSLQFDVMSIPTFLIFKEGKVVAKTVGVQDKEEIISLLKNS